MYLRVDDRLIHGQVVTAWIKQLKLKKILVVDDMAAANKIIGKTLKMACPKGVALTVATTEDGKALVASQGEESLIICKLPVTALALYQANPDHDWTVCVGNVSGAAGRETYSKSVHLDAENHAAALELKAQPNVDIFMQTTPGDTQTRF